MKEGCRICARELCGNQRRWIFHPAAKLNLQVVLSHALCCDVQRDGRSEFICSKCSFMLERMYRFDTVIARVQALSIERLQRLLQEKQCLRQCISVLYHKNNNYMTGGTVMRTVNNVKYRDLLQDDLVYSMYESWADDVDQTPECIHVSQCQASDASSLCLSSRRCRVCRALRVADSDYEAVCKVPRKVARSVSCDPSTRYSTSRMASRCGEEQVPERESSDSDRTHRDCESSAAWGKSLQKTLNAQKTLQDDEEMSRKGEDDPNSDSEDHVEAVGRPTKLALALSLVLKCAHRPVQSPRGSKLPVLIKTGFFNEGTQQDGSDQIFRSLFDDTHCLLVEPELPRIQLDTGSELARIEELWHDEYMTLCVRKFPKSLMEEQQSQLNQYECAAGQYVSELQKAQLQVHSLQMKIHESEDANKVKDLLHIFIYFYKQIELL